MAFQDVMRGFEMGQQIGNMYHDAKAGQAYKDAYDGASTDQQQGLKDAASTVARPATREDGTNQYDSSDFMPGGIASQTPPQGTDPQVAEQQARNTVNANTYSDLADKAPPPTESQRQAAGLRAQGEYYKGIGKTDKALELSGKAKAIEAQDMDIKLKQGAVDMQPLQNKLVQQEVEQGSIRLDTAKQLKATNDDYAKVLKAPLSDQLEYLNNHPNSYSGVLNKDGTVTMTDKATKRTATIDPNSPQGREMIQRGLGEMHMNDLGAIDPQFMVKARELAINSRHADASMISAGASAQSAATGARALNYTMSSPTEKTVAVPIPAVTDQNGNVVQAATVKYVPVNITHDENGKIKATRVDGSALSSDEQAALTAGHGLMADAATLAKYRLDRATGAADAENAGTLMDWWKGKGLGPSASYKADYAKAGLAGEQSLAGTTPVRADAAARTAQINGKDLFAPSAKKVAPPMTPSVVPTAAPTPAPVAPATPTESAPASLGLKGGQSDLQRIQEIQQLLTPHQTSVGRVGIKQMTTGLSPMEEMGLRKELANRLASVGQR